MSKDSLLTPLAVDGLTAVNNNPPIEPDLDLGEALNDALDKPGNDPHPQHAPNK